ncbi:MAG: hypothetical protein KF871_06315 [Hydrogenophaga sp.]|uniref:hypothetical protein n=1 Tax=Hydrogenophaga sp. TaxID=1904254 RepID=UPI001D598D4E|nr:hypothetical protein [Hydrogenophaga sp.]MBX3609495.1 hypothetical protein [Hydrogenophaga sp.]
MSHAVRHPIHTLALAAALAFATTGALADKPDHAGKPEYLKEHSGKSDKHARRDDDHERRGSDDRTSVSVQINVGGYFTVSQRRAVVDYYEPRFKAGKCPPGLAKKNNGCQPPGLAKAWRKGQPLPRDVAYYPVPEGVSIRLGLPPEGHKFIRVASDILLIAVGTGMVVDAIEDLSRL